MTNDEILAILKEHPELIPKVLEILTRHKLEPSSGKDATPAVTSS